METVEEILNRLFERHMSRSYGDPRGALTDIRRRASDALSVNGLKSGYAPRKAELAAQVVALATITEELTVHLDSARNTLTQIAERRGDALSNPGDVAARAIGRVHPKPGGPTPDELAAARKRLQPYIDGYPEPMIDTRRLRIANGTASVVDQREIAAEDAVLRELRG